MNPEAVTVAPPKACITGLTEVKTMPWRRVLRLPAGLDVRKISSPGRSSEVFFLDIHFYRTRLFRCEQRKGPQPKLATFVFVLKVGSERNFIQRAINPMPGISKLMQMPVGSGSCRSLLSDP